MVRHNLEMCGRPVLAFEVTGQVGKLPLPQSRVAHVCPVYKGHSPAVITPPITIIETVDKYGLKRRHLHKHRRQVDEFLQSVQEKKLSSDFALKYQSKFAKYGERLFTFLDHDGVPWNNNNAEHAIKRFVKYRRHADGRFTEKSLGDHLVLLSVLETCEYKNLPVLRFLLSKATELSRSSMIQAEQVMRENRSR